MQNAQGSIVTPVISNEHTVTCIQPGGQLHKMHTTILTKEGARI